jgi:hypothetical protein
MPTATMTPPIIDQCQHLFPSRLSYVNPNQPTNTHFTRGTTTHTHPNFPFKPSTLHQALSSLKRGTAGGPFADLTDTLKSYALFSPTTQADEEPSLPHFDTFAELIQLILNNNIPESIARLLRSNRFIAFHKDPSDPTKLRPIGIGTAYRRVIGALITSTYAPDFAQLLLPQGQVGIAVKGGIELLIHSAQIQLNQYIQQPIDNHQHPQRALLLLDIVNMFNETSRDCAKDVLLSHPEFHPLLPYFDLMYGTYNECFYKTPDGAQDRFLQHEGFPQGDPLATILSCLVLHRLLEQLNARLLQRAKTRLNSKQAGDDGLGSQSATSSFIDDTFAYLTYEDLAPFLQDFKELGPPLGIRLNRTKTKILTTTSTQPSSTHLSTTQLHHLHLALAELNGKDSEVTHGTRFLGAPLGSTDYVNTFLDNAATTFHTQTQRLIARLPNKQTACTLFKLCAIPSLSHLLATDVLHNTVLDSPPSLTTWHSPFAARIHITTSLFLQHLSDSLTDLPDLSWLIAHTPIRDGGIGIRDHEEAAVTSFLIPIIRSIRIATIGAQVGTTFLPLPPIYSRPFRPWATQRHPTRLVTVFKHLLPSLLATHNLLEPTHALPNIQSLVKLLPLQGLQSRIYQHLQTSNLTSAIDHAPIHFQIALPSLLSPSTSIALHSLSRRHSHSHLANDLYTLLIQRKLRLPIFPPSRPPPPCRYCTQLCDPYGDHLFSCKYSKTPLHNSIRNTLYTILSTTAPIAGTTHSKFDVLIEPTNLLPEYPLRRPADIALRLKTPTATQSTTLAIDVTITPVPTNFRSQPTLSQPSNLHAAHLRSIRSKLTGRTHGNVHNSTLTQAINAAHITLLPFTVDHLGGLGYFSHRLFFHPTYPNPPPLPEPPPTTFTDTHFPHPHAYRAYDNLLRHTPGILSQANREWSALRPHRPQRFGQTYHSATPLQWALQCFSLNLCHSLASHLLRARASCVAAATSSTITPHTLGPAFYQTLHQPTLVPGTPRHLPTHSLA